MIRKLRRILFWTVMTAWVFTLVSYWSFVAVGHMRSEGDEPLHAEIAKRDAPVTEAPKRPEPEPEIETEIETKTETACKPVECKCPSLNEKEDENEQPKALERKVPGPPVTNYPLVQLKSYIPNYFTKASESEKQLIDQDTTLVFVHGQKASVTMKGCVRLVQQSLPYAPSPPEVVYDDVVVQFYRSHAEPSTSLGKFYYGEATFGVCELSHGHKPCAYYTVLREPYERVVSLYDFCRGDKNAKERICNLWDFGSTSVVEYARALGSHVFAHFLYNYNICSDRPDNVKKVNDALAAVGAADKIDTSRRAFCWYRHKAFMDYYLSKEEKDKLLEYILENLENWFSVIGLFEEYTLSLEMLEQAFGVPFQKCAAWKRNPYEEKRSQANRNERILLKNQLMADRNVYQSLYYDLRIYDEALKIFHLQKAKFFGQ